MGGGSVQEQNRKGLVRVIIDLRGFILKGIFGYKITKVWQLKKEEGRGKDTIQCLLLEGVATTGWFLLDSFWLKHRTLLGTCHIQGAELGTRRLSREMRTNLLQMINDFYSLWLASTLIFFPLNDLKYLEMRKAGVRRRLGRLLEKEFKGREDNNHLPVIIITFHIGFWSFTNLPNSFRKDFPCLYLLA